MKLPAASGRGIMMDFILYSPKVRGILFRLINCVSQDQSLTDSITKILSFYVRIKKIKIK